MVTPYGVTHHMLSEVYIKLKLQGLSMHRVIIAVSQFHSFTTSYKLGRHTGDMHKPRWARNFNMFLSKTVGIEFLRPVVAKTLSTVISKGLVNQFFRCQENILDYIIDLKAMKFE